jgi:hypothetical protein
MSDWTKAVATLVVSDLLAALLGAMIGTVWHLKRWHRQRT